MPEYSQIEEIDQSQPLDMSNVKYSASDIFGAGLVSSYGNYITNNMVGALSKVAPDANVPLSQPADKSYVESLKKDRPGFNPPTGIPQFLALQLQQQYDNNQYFEKVKTHPASIMGKLGALSGSLIGGTADVKNLIYGVPGATAAEAFIAPIAESFITKLASNEIIGSSVAKVGTAISNSAISGAGFGFTAQVSAETEQFEREELFGESHHYIDALQNLGSATLYGAIAGIGFHAVGRTAGFGRDALIGKRVEISPAQYERQGGLLPKLDLPDRVKDVIAKAWKPWTKAADDVTKTESVGQMANGNLVDIEPVIKQGMYEEGVAFRDELAKEGIDQEELDRQLSDAQEKIVSEMFSKYFAEQEEKNKPFNRLSIDEDLTQKNFYHGTGELSDIGDFSLTRGGLGSLYGEGLYITDNKDIAKSYAEKRGRSGGNILGLKFKRQPKLIDINESPKNDVFDIIKKIAGDNGVKLSDSLKTKKLEEIFSIIKGVIRDEHGDMSGAMEHIYETISRMNNELHDAGYDGYLHTGGKITKGKPHNVAVMFGQDYMQNGVHVLKSPAELLEQKSIESLDDLKAQHDAAQAIRDHLNDAHEALSQGEMEAYGQHLKESNMPDNGYNIEAGERYTVDEQLDQYTDKDIESLAEATKDSDVGGQEIIKSAEKLKNQNVYEDMAQNMTDCILKGGL